MARGTERKARKSELVRSPLTNSPMQGRFGSFGLLRHEPSQCLELAICRDQDPRTREVFANVRTGIGGGGSSRHLRPLVDCVGRHLAQRLLDVAVSCRFERESSSPPQDIWVVRGTVSEGSTSAQATARATRRSGVKEGRWSTLSAAWQSRAQRARPPCVSK